MGYGLWVMGYLLEHIPEHAVVGLETTQDYMCLCEHINVYACYCMCICVYMYICI